jgi:protein gp37
MGENSNISWTDHTFNPWVGCTKVSPACDGCYAEAMMDLRYGKVKWGGEHVRTSVSNWRLPAKWNKDAGLAGARPRVFSASLADVFDNQVPPAWREDLFELIRVTPNLTWLLLTKRPQNIVKMVQAAGAIAGNGTRYLPRNAALGTTIEDQRRADINVPALLNAKEQLGPAYVFVSCEPLLGPIDMRPWLSDLDGVIAGGETDQGAHKARPTHPDWIRSLRDQSARTGTAFHFKQWGEWAPGECADFAPLKTERTATWFVDEWSFGALTPRESEEMHYDDAPDLYRIGKKRAGRHLDGELHNAMPAVRT